MNKKVLILTIVTLLFTGCATKMTTSGTKVSEISAKKKTTCTFIGNEETSRTADLASNGNRRDVLSSVRNITAELGGDSYVLNQCGSNGLGLWSAKFEVYKCQK
jgi:outer membrane lipoprotein SlyB